MADSESSVVRTRGTVLGLLAILFWSTTIAFSRLTTEAFGFLTAAAITYAVAGLISCAVAALRRRFWLMLQAPRRYLFGCGALMVAYTVSLYAALGLAPSEQETVLVGLVNYLWPVLVLVLSVPILGNKWRWALVPGALAGVAGTVLAVVEVRGLALTDVGKGALAHPLPLLFALVCAVTWGLFSNLSRRWGDPRAPSAMPLFMLATGAVLWALRPLRAETPHWQPGAVLALAYVCLFPTILAYVFWDIAMRTGHFVIVGSASYLTPLLSTGITCLVLGAMPGPLLWIGAGLVVIGAATCRLSLVECPGSPSEIPSRGPLRS